MKMDHDLLGFDEASDPGLNNPVEHTNWVGHVARVPPKAAPRGGPRPSYTPGGVQRTAQPQPKATPAPAKSRATPAPVGRVAIPIAPPEELPRPASFRTPAPAPGREFDFAGEHAAPVQSNSSSTLVLVGAGIGAATAALVGSVGVIAVVAAVVLLLPPRQAIVEATPGQPVVVTARPGEQGPSRAIVSRDVKGGPTAARVGRAGSSRSAPATGGAAAPAPSKGWVESTVDAVAAFVAPEPVVPATAPSTSAFAPPSAATAQPSAPVPHVVGAPGSPSAVEAAFRPSGAAPAGDLSVADQVVVTRPGATGWEPAGAGVGPGTDAVAQGRPVDEIAMPVPAGDDWGAPAASAGGWAPAPAPVASGWMSAVNTVTALVTGSGPEAVAPGTQPASNGYAPNSLAVDDLEDLGTGRTNGWDQPARADDPALAILADLDRPSAPAAGGVAAASATADDMDDLLADLSSDRPAREIAPVGAEPAIDPMDALLADLDRPVDAPSPSPSPAGGVGAASAADPAGAPAGAPAPGTLGYEVDPYTGAPVVAGGVVAGNAGYVQPAAAPTASGGWYDTVVSVGSSVASLVVGGGDGSAVFAPGTPGTLEPSGPGLALDDDLSVGAQNRTGWNAAADADDPALRMLADLDSPSAPRGVASAGARPSNDAVAQLDERVLPPQSIEPDRATDELLASLADDRPAPSADPGLVATAAAWAGSMADAVMGGQSPAPTQEQLRVEAAQNAAATGGYAPSGGYAAADGTTGGYPAGLPTGASAYFESTAMVPAAPVQRQCIDGELCEDDTLGTWRDDGNHQNLLEEDDLELTPTRRKTEAELFATPSAEEPDEEGAFDGFHTLLLNVTTDVPGIPVEIDGHPVGSTPLVAEVTPGKHAVRLHGGGGAVTMYTLEARTDPDEWCFELHGRSLKNVTCR